MLKHMQNLGGSILTVAETTKEEFTSRSKAISVESGLPAWAHPVLYLPTVQLMTYYQAMSRGQNPDQPTNLDAVNWLESLVDS